MSSPRYGFQTPIDVRYLPSQLWRLRWPVRYLSALTQKAYTIDGGFEFDGASVPGVSLVAIADRHSAFAAALLHDWLVNHPEIEPPSVADDLFLEVMAGMFHAGNFYEGMREPVWRRVLMYQAVKRFGAHHFTNADGLGFQPPLSD